MPHTLDQKAHEMRGARLRRVPLDRTTREDRLRARAIDRLVFEQGAMTGVECKPAGMIERERTRRTGERRDESKIRPAAVLCDGRPLRRCERARPAVRAKTRPRE